MTRTGRPAWYRTARNLGGVHWVPFEVAHALQEQLDAHRIRLSRTEEELALVRRATGSAEARVEAAHRETEAFRREAEAARRDAAAAAERLAECEPVERAEDARVVQLLADVDNVRRHRDAEIERARRAARIEGLRSLAEVHDDLLRSLEANTDTASPWYAGHTAIYDRVRAEIRRLGAVPLGAAGEAFDPQVHEAVALSPSREPEGTVLSVVQVGFQLEGGGLVRPARVVVSTGEQAVG